MSVSITSPNYRTQGVHAIFAVTNWWEYLFSGKSQDEAGEIEHQQGMNLARAAAKTSSLEHYIWSSLPSAETITKGKLKVPHVCLRYPLCHWRGTKLLI